MSVNAHPTHKGWWEIRYRPNGRSGRQKVVVSKGTLEEARTKERKLIAEKSLLGEVCGKYFMGEIEVDMKFPPYIYFIQQGDSGPIKIGYSENPCRRLAFLKTANPFPLKIVGLISNASLRIEVETHNKFANMRMEGEWFEPRLALINFIKKYCRNGIDGKIRLWKDLTKEILDSEEKMSIDDLVLMHQINQIG